MAVTGGLDQRADLRVYGMKDIRRAREEIIQREATMADNRRFLGSPVRPLNLS